MVSTDAATGHSEHGTTRRLLTAELLSIGTELTVGETLDTNAGELARSLVQAGVRVLRVTALPDELATVVAAFREALTRADLVVATGGLGPTPDDLTREAVAEVCGETPVVDAGLLTWLQELWARRGQPFPEANVKQAWVIPSGIALPNPNGTAPGWLVVRPDGRVIVTLPGPPREMRPMWADEVLPRLHERGLGRALVVRTLRLTGIGESQVADRLGEDILRATNPIVATYARADAVDVRISAFDEATTGDGPARSAAELVDAAERLVLAAVGSHVWARGATTWPQAIAAALAEHAWSLATIEHGTGGAIAALLGEMSGLCRAEVTGIGARTGDAADIASAEALMAIARRAREQGGADVGLAVHAGEEGGDTLVAIAVVTPGGDHHEQRLAFLTGPMARTRAALAASAVLLERLREGQAG